VHVLQSRETPVVEHSQRHDAEEGYECDGKNQHLATLAFTSWRGMIQHIRPELVTFAADPAGSLASG
jgi:hypothetical protein